MLWLPTSGEAQIWLCCGVVHHSLLSSVLYPICSWTCSGCTTFPVVFNVCPVIPLKRVQWYRQQKRMYRQSSVKQNFRNVQLASQMSPYYYHQEMGNCEKKKCMLSRCEGWPKRGFKDRFYVFTSRYDEWLTVMVRVMTALPWHISVYQIQKALLNISGFKLKSGL